MNKEDLRIVDYYTKKDGMSTARFHQWVVIEDNVYGVLEGNEGEVFTIPNP
ncbi:MAG: hypothetical protein GX159_09725 [Flavobacteriaceae bacterium]|jgi:hypothetical protein|nr:hypothetical protein [Flavobacteriaceae bacterium]